MTDLKMSPRMLSVYSVIVQRQSPHLSKAGTKNANTAIISNQYALITAQFVINVCFSWIIIAVSFISIMYLAWVNNCLGLENYRYFLLFILYLMIGLIYNLVTIVSVWNHHAYKQHTSLMSFISILDMALVVVLLGFNGWNWFLALTGLSTIEFWGKTSKVTL